MNKTLALSLALLFAVASAQTGKSTVGGWCTRNDDCNQFGGLCCSGFASNSSLTPYTQLNCVAHVNGTAVLKTNNCLLNGTDYTAICADEDKTCVNPTTKYVACGNSLVMATIDLFNSAINCTSKSSAMTLAASAFFAMIAALALLF
jgi:hypothetical protein